ncbi:hypothetical protein SODALDRAFT_357398 [Sodiomyces alkalinus F11]|uniref:Uncharacterized protein n=1 Tax=Sodiomyces alkalinus (strain CBS 110278 / VKM F-3762 / F11) TaxID=1314773 RepID=A0A3N2Q3M8_SODAK|nr:hypothetical protein SODALDRAFT_357398 [Sodiomyces alkalinus F11]ROT41363.1 hypothetical protein SODALDRAFT_357398 [Sodiomyces alkalinus F11]
MLAWHAAQSWCTVCSHNRISPSSIIINTASAHVCQPHLNDSIRQVSETSWLVFNTALLTHSPLQTPDHIPNGQACWSDGHEGHFTLSAAPNPLPDSDALAEDSTLISLVHAVDNQAAVWRAGEAFIKAHHMEVSPCHWRAFASKVPGQLLDDAWPILDEPLWQHCICKVAGLLERYLVKRQLLDNCTSMAMDVSSERPNSIRTMCLADGGGSEAGSLALQFQDHPFVITHALGSIAASQVSHEEFSHK